MVEPTYFPKDYLRRIEHNGHVAFIRRDPETGMYQWGFAYNVQVFRTGYTSFVELAEEEAKHAMQHSPPGDAT